MSGDVGRGVPPPCVASPDDALARSFSLFLAIGGASGAGAEDGVDGATGVTLPGVAAAAFPAPFPAPLPVALLTARLVTEDGAVASFAF